MNIHSYACPGPPARSQNRPWRQARRAAARRHRHIRRPRLFNAQVADVARAAGVAAGTVYLYFRGKDDLLISIFERTMKEAIAEGRASIAALAERRWRGCGASPRSISIGWAATARSPSSSRSSCASRRSSWSSFSATKLREYLGIIRDIIAAGQAGGEFRKDVNPTFAAKLFFGMLDEMATNWILSKRKYSLAVRSGRDRRTFSSSGLTPTRRGRVDDAIQIGSGRSARAPWAPRLPPISPTPVCRRCCSTSRTTAADGLKRARAAEAGSVLHARGATSIRTGGFDDELRSLDACDWIVEAVVERLDIKQSLFEQLDAHRGAARDRQLQYVGHSDRRTRRGSLRGVPPPLSRHAFLQPAALPAAARSDPDCRHRPGVSSSCAHVIRRSPARQGRRHREGHARTSSPTASACSA